MSRFDCCCLTVAIKLAVSECPLAFVMFSLICGLSLGTEAPIVFPCGVDLSADYFLDKLACYFALLEMLVE